MRAAFLLLAALFSAGQATAQNSREYFVSGNWRGAAHYEASGSLRFCSMRAGYRSGITLYFALDRTGVFSLGFANPDWVLKVGSKHPLAIRIDGQLVHNGTATVLGERRGRLVLIDLPRSAALINRFRGGHVLHVYAPRGRMGFSLHGTSLGLRRLVHCVATQIKNKRAAANPFSSPENRDDSTATDPGRVDSSDRVRAVTLIANVLGRAGITDYKILLSEDIPKRWRRYHALWRSGKTIGLVRLYGKTTPKSRRAIHSIAVAADFDLCEGAYQSGVKRAIGPGRPITFFSRCDDNGNDNDWSLVYIIIGPDRAGKTYFFGLFSPDKNEPIDLGTKLRDALLAVVLDRVRNTDPVKGEQRQ